MEGYTLPLDISLFQKIIAFYESLLFGPRFPNSKTHLSEHFLQCHAVGGGVGLQGRLPKVGVPNHMAQCVGS
jgi:hypothetical protein